jgi:hypothetical protein
MSKDEFISMLNEIKNGSKIWVKTKEKMM